MSPTASSNGLSLWYESFGDPADPTLLLISGLGSQAVNWEVELCEELVSRGLRVVRYDVRDVGLSEKLVDAPVPDLAAIVRGAVTSPPYTLEDMADDALGLLDALEIDRAHVFGRSMGGMIAQILALKYPDRVRSIALLSSSTGSRSVGQPDAEVVVQSLSRRSDLTPEEAIEAMAEGYRLRGSSGLGVTDEERLARARREYERSHYPPGAARQMAAVLCAGDRTQALSTLDVPALVIHGSADRLVSVSGGEALADTIPKAESLFIEGMGHDLPRVVWPQVVEALLHNIERSDS